MELRESDGSEGSIPLRFRHVQTPAKGLLPGRAAKDCWKREDHSLGDATFTHVPDGTAHENRG